MILRFENIACLFCRENENEEHQFCFYTEILSFDHVAEKEEMQTVEDNS